jgi:hypothetical protein
MSRFMFGAGCGLTALLLMSTGMAEAATLYVNCAAKEGLHSIGAAVRVLQNVPGPSTIDVSGACHENVLLQNIDRLTIAGSKGASLTDASGGAADVIDIRNSNVTITGMTLDGLSGVNNDTVDCEQGSHCTLLGNTIQGGAEPVGVYAVSSAVIVGGVLQNGTSDGLFAFGEVAAFGVLIQGNPVGVVSRFGGRVRIGITDPATFPGFSRTPTTIQNNGAGVQVLQAQFACSGCIIQVNSGDGINADVSAQVRVGPAFFIDGSSAAPSVTQNTGRGVYLGDLSSGIFAGPASTVSGNGQPDIVCNSTTSVSRGAVTAAGGAAHTNCTN